MPGPRDGEQQDGVGEEKDAHDGAENAHGPGGGGEEDEGESQVRQGETGVAKGEEARAARAEAGGRHECRHQQNRPPKEGQKREHDRRVPHDPHAPEVIRGDLSAGVSKAIAHAMARVSNTVRWGWLSIPLGHRG